MAATMFSAAMMVANSVGITSAMAYFTKSDDKKHAPSSGWWTSEYILTQDDPLFIRVCDYVESRGSEIQTDAVKVQAPSRYLTGLLWNLNFIRHPSMEDAALVAMPPHPRDENPMSAACFVPYKSLTFEGWNLEVLISECYLKFRFKSFTVSWNRAEFEKNYNTMSKNFRKNLSRDSYRMAIYQCSISRTFVSSDNEIDHAHIPFLPQSYFRMGSVKSFITKLGNFYEANKKVSSESMAFWELPRGMGAILYGGFGCGKSFQTYYLADKFGAAIIDFDGQKKSKWSLLEKKAVESRQRVICVFDEFDKIIFSDILGTGSLVESENGNCDNGSNAVPVGTVLTMFDRMLMNPNVVILMMVNDISKVHPGFLRCGRAGSIKVRVGFLTADDIQEFLKKYVPTLESAFLAKVGAGLPANAEISVADMHEYLREKKYECPSTDNKRFVELIFKDNWHERYVRWKEQRSHFIDAPGFTVTDVVVRVAAPSTKK